MKTYDAWKATNPADEFLGPEPEYDIPEPDDDGLTLLQQRDELLETVKQLTDALDRIMEYAHTGASVRDVYPSEQPQFIAARKAISSGRAIIGKMQR